MTRLEQPIQITHQKLIQRCIKGEAVAQKKLYQLYSRNMLNVAYRIVNHEEDARDVLQESFIKAFQQLPNFRFEASFGSWLKRIVINTSINHVKKKNILFNSDPADLQNNAALEEDEVEDEDNFALNVHLAKKALSSLPDGYRSVLTLYLLEGYQHKEIAEILNISVSTSLTQYQRGKRKLKTILKQLSAKNKIGGHG